MPHALRLRTATVSHREIATPTPAAERGLRAWWNRNVVAMDPHPEAGLLDQLDHRSAPDRFRPVPFDTHEQRVA